MPAIIPPNFLGAHKPLDHAAIVAEAAQLQCKTAIVHAFSDIESTGSGFLSDGRMKALFEARYFHLQTGGKYDRIAPNLSSPVWDRSLYGAGGGHQLDRLSQAMRLDPEAALKSCSIGRYQIMGANHAMVGYATIWDMWAAFCDDEQEHIKAFGLYIVHAGLLPAIRANPPKFVALSVGYNGSGEAANGYDQKLETTFFHYVAQGEGNIPQPSGAAGRADDPAAPPLQPASPHIIRELRAGMTGPDVKILQRALNIPDDGVFGRKVTEPAVIAYQRAHGLQPVDGIAGHDTLSALGLL